MGKNKEEMTLIRTMNGREPEFCSDDVKIICPNCGKICEAKIEYVDGWPFADYTHECEHCGFMITESQWEEVNDKEKQNQRNKM